MPRQTNIQVRRGTASDWSSSNPTLAQGEPGFETDTKKMKIGNGSTAWNSLPYFSVDGGNLEGSSPSPTPTPIPPTPTPQPDACAQYAGQQGFPPGCPDDLPAFWIQNSFANQEACVAATLPFVGNDQNSANQICCGCPV